MVAINGKTIRNSNDDSSGKSAIHLVSAYANENNLCLGQEAVSEKSNEITAIPKLLELLMLKGCIVTIDAMGCQKKIAEKIIEKVADYILMVKNNQKNLMTQIKQAFETMKCQDANLQDDCGHGRVESRECSVISDLSTIDKRDDWKGIKSIVRIKSVRFQKKKETESTEYRYYITSLDPEADKIGNAVRYHWAIENKLHWNLDVVFKEDASLKKKGESPMNFTDYFGIR